MMTEPIVARGGWGAPLEDFERFARGGRAAPINLHITADGDHRRRYRVEELPDEYDQEEQISQGERAEVVNPADANLVGSKRTDSETVHQPVIDLDVPHRLVPSTTPGHSHLYIDVDVPWYLYLRLLQTLADCGIVEQGFVNMANLRGQTFVRAPGVTKDDL